MPRKTKEIEPRPEPIATITPIPPVVPIERVYRLAREGSCGNLRVEEISIQGEQIIGRHYVSERDAKPFAMARIMGLIEDQVRRDYR